MRRPSLPVCIATDTVTRGSDVVRSPPPGVDAERHCCIFPVMGIDITFLVAHLCGTFGVALGALGLLGTLPTGRQVTEDLHLQNLTYELPAGNILTCRQTLPLRRSVSHVTEFKSIGAEIDFGI